MERDRRWPVASGRVAAVAGFLVVLLGAACELTSDGEPADVPADIADTPQGTGPWTLAPDTLRQDCQRTADELGFPVPCPTVVPGDFDPEMLDGRVAAWGEGFHFSAPLSGHLETPSPEETVFHVLVKAGQSRFSDCDGTEYSSTTLRGWQTTLYDCPETGGLHADHILAMWEDDGIWYEVSSHVVEDRQFHEEVVVHIMRGIELVHPDG